MRNCISKHNAGNTDFTVSSTDKTVILALDQAEGDASIRHGSPQIHHSLDLSRTICECHPDTYIIYRPRPGVVNDNRTGRISAEGTTRCADQTTPGVSILICLQYADEVHTMTSFTGFETLLCDKKICYYGLLSYTGWGLT